MSCNFVTQSEEDSCDRPFKQIL